MALTDNLAGYWKLDEASGNALDALGANDLTATNSPGTGTGKISNCRTFSGSSQYFTKADNSDLSTGDIDFTLQVWVNPSAITGTPVILGKWSGSAGTREYDIQLNSSGRPIFNVLNSSGVTGAATWGSSLSNGTWALIHAWHDSVNDLIGISVNAGTAVTSSWATGVRDGVQPFQIGGSSGGVSYWNGSIDEVGFWKRVLTSTERTTLYNSGAGLAYPWSSGATNYTITCDTAYTAVVGQSVGIQVARKIVLGPAVTAVPGQSVGIAVGRNIPLAPATTPVVGQPVAVQVNRVIPVSPAATAVIGQAVAISRQAAIALSPAVTTTPGQAVAVSVQRRIALAPAITHVVGQAVSIIDSGVTPPTPTYRQRYILRRPIPNSPGATPPSDAVFRARKST